MKKVFAKFLTLILTITMLVSVMPSAFAEGETVSLPTGNTAGRLTDGLTIKVGDGTTMTETALLADGFHYSTSERLKLGVRPQDDAGTRMITLDNTNNTIEFSWETAQSVKRLEMWIWRVGAVKNYKIQVSDDGAVWNDYTTGSFDQTQPLPADSDTKGGAAIFYLAQFNSVTTKYLRFVVTEFGNGQTSAFVAEAIPRSSDMVNLLGDLTLSAEYALGSHVHNGEDNKEPWTRINASSYAFGFNATGWKQIFSSAQNLSGYSLSHSTCETWQSFGSGYPTMMLSPATGADYTYYTTSFLASPQAINRVGVKPYAGTINEIEVYYSQATSWPGENSSTWVKCATEIGTWTSSKPAVINIPGAPKAEYWKVKITKFSGNLQVYPIEMYSLYQSTTLFGNGASFAEGKNGSVLTDKVYYVAYDKPSSPAPSNNLDKLAKFTAVDSGVQFSWEKEQKVSRLDFWILSHGGVKDYEIQVSEDGNVWNKYQEGSFAKYDSVTVEASTTASYYPVILETPVTTKYIRFVIKSFYDNSIGAYMSEATIYSNNDIDFGKLGIFGTGDNIVNRSPYIASYYASDTNSKLPAHRKNSPHTWATYSSGELVPMAPDSENFWYATAFNKSKVKVNRVGINLSSGTATEIEIWACETSDKLSSLWMDEPPCPADESFSGHHLWKKIDTFQYDFSSSTNDVTFDIPQSVEANAWMVKINGYTSNARLSSVEMYSVADYEIAPEIGEGSISIDDDTLSKGDVATFSIFACNKNYPDAAVFFALYSGDTLIDAAKEDMPISGIDTFEAKYTVPEDAEGDLNLKAYLWDGKTLVPILNGPATK